MTCPECGSSKARPTTLGVMVACLNCGKLYEGSFAKADAQDPTAAGELVVPDLMEPVEGWRSWCLRTEWGMPVLESVTQQGHFWQPRAVMEAECLKGREHPTPSIKCSCGLYAAKTLEHLLGMHYSDYDGEQRFHVIGRVKFWGTVIEGTQGWRATFGYPDELFVPYEAWKYAEDLTETYGVKVGLKNWLAPIESA